MITLRTVVINLLLVLFPILLFGQDRIILSNNDTVIGKIKKVDSLYVRFVPAKSNSRRAIPRSMVLDFEKNYQLNSSDSLLTRSQVFRKHSGISISAGNGVGYLINPAIPQVPNSFSRYNRKIRLGYTFDFDVHYFFGKYFGLGLRYSVFTSSASFDNVVFEDLDGSFVLGTLQDRLTFQTVELSTQGRFELLNNALGILPSAHFGYGHFNNNAFRGRKIIYNSHSFSYGFDIGIDTRVSKRLRIGIKGGISIANFKTIHFSHKDDEGEFELEDDDLVSATRTIALLVLRYTIH